MNTLHDLMVNEGIMPGMAVISKAGHDKGKIYLVISVEGSFVWLADGWIRTISKLKMKRCKHVRKLAQAAGDTEMKTLLAEKTPAQQDILIRKTLSTLVELNKKEV